MTVETRIEAQDAFDSVLFHHREMNGISRRRMRCASTL
jgi:hypothetical protein